MGPQNVGLPWLALGSELQSQHERGPEQRELPGSLIRLEAGLSDATFR